MRFGRDQDSNLGLYSAGGRHHLTSYATASDHHGLNSIGSAQIVHGHWNGNWGNGTVTSGNVGGGATRGQSISHYGAQPFFWGSYAGGIGGSAFGWGQGSLIYGSGYLNYLNPYYSSMDLSGFYNYTQPVLISNNASNPSKTVGSTPANFFQGLVNSAVAAFLSGDYDTALEIANRGIDEFPDEAVLHEFRALVLFSKGDYQQAAATIHAVLAVGPGWDWTTLISLYRDANVYTTQLRALEAAVKKNSEDGAIRFLLAYHYLTDGYPDAAARILKRVVTLVPNDQVAANLLKMVSAAGQTPSEEPAAQPTPDAPSTELSPTDSLIDSAKLVGTWEATRADGTKFSLNLTDDQKFNWRFTLRQLPPQSLTGTYSFVKNVISLETGGRGTFVAKLKFTADNRFNFKAVGSPDEDPGLDFGPSGAK
jgi:tetratricopeptide (TPR) repeat protein